MANTSTTRQTVGSQLPTRDLDETEVRRFSDRGQRRPGSVVEQGKARVARTHSNPCGAPPLRPPIPFLSYWKLAIVILGVKALVRHGAFSSDAAASTRVFTSALSSAIVLAQQCPPEILHS